MRFRIYLRPLSVLYLSGCCYLAIPINTEAQRGIGRNQNVLAHEVGGSIKPGVSEALRA
jgi:hypothetical protein